MKIFYRPFSPREDTSGAKRDPSGRENLVVQSNTVPQLPKCLTYGFLLVRTVADEREVPIFYHLGKSIEHFCS